MSEKIFLIPYGHIQLTSYTPSVQVETTLAEHTEETKIGWGRMKREGRKFFEGTVGDGKFSISRVIHYRNSFKPILYGRIEPDEDRTQINVRIHFHPIIIAFSAVFFTAFGCGGLTTSLSLLAEQEFAAAMGFLPILPAMLFYTLIMFLFNMEIRKSFKQLREILADETY